MITYLEAKQRVLRLLALSKLELVIVPPFHEEPFGWLVNYNTKAYIETGNPIDCLLGGGPLIVNKFTGETVQLGGLNVEQQLIEYREKWKPH